MLSNRPMVVPAGLNLEVELIDDTRVFVTVDGQEGREMHMGDRIVAEVSPLPLLVVQSAKRNYFELLREKLHFGER
jgi:NAD+ kinase